MKKTLTTALCTAAVAAMAMPAFADHQIGGYYRFNGLSEMVTAIGQKDDQKPDQFVDQRLRARWQNNINEYVSVVWFGEVDVIFGEGVTKAAARDSDTAATKDTRLGNGGRQGGDGVNVETKNAFLDVKVPGTPVAARLGLQGFGDNAFNGVVMNDDMAGVKVDVKTDLALVTLGWFKLSEGTGATLQNNVNRRDWDESDLYAVQAAVTPLPGLKLLPEFYFADNMRTAASGDGFRQYYAGFGASFKLAPVDLSGWAIYQFGNDKKADEKVGAYALSVKAAADVAGAKVALRGMFFPADKKDDKQTNFTPPNGNNGAFEFYDDNLTIFLADVNYMNSNGGRLALTDAAYNGYGLLGAVLSGSFTPPALPQMYVKGGLGYFRVTDKEPGDAGTVARRELDGKTLGTEISAAVGYKLAEKVDVQLRGGYAWLGNAYNGAAADGEDPKDLYKLALMVNVPY